MSDREKDMVQRIAELPPALQEKMLDTLNGAVMAMEVLEKKQEGGEA